MRSERRDRVGTVHRRTGLLRSAPSSIAPDCREGFPRRRRASRGRPDCQYPSRRTVRQPTARPSPRSDALRCRLPPRCSRTSSCLPAATSTFRPARGTPSRALRCRCLFGLKIVALASTRSTSVSGAPASSNSQTLAALDLARRRVRCGAAPSARCTPRCRESSARSRPRGASRVHRFDETPEKRRAAGRREHVVAFTPIEMIEVPPVALRMRHDRQHVAFRVHQSRAAERRPVGNGARRRTRRSQSA